MRRPNVLRLVPALRSNSCNVGVITGSVMPVADLLWNGAPSAFLALIDEQSDRTLDEFVVAMHKRRIEGSRSALGGFLLLLHQFALR